MGLGPFRDYDDSVERVVYVNRNPNPQNFHINWHESNGEYIVASVRYPDCTNYEGIKILVYKGVPLEDFLNAKALDPHFSDKGMAPIARFKPDQEGVENAMRFAGFLVSNTPIE